MLTTLKVLLVQFLTVFQIFLTLILMVSICTIKAILILPSQIMLLIFLIMISVVRRVLYQVFINGGSRSL